jgi:hypothetical protein
MTFSSSTEPRRPFHPDPRVGCQFTITRVVDTQCNSCLLVHQPRLCKIPAIKLASGPLAIQTLCLTCRRWGRMSFPPPPQSCCMNGAKDFVNEILKHQSSCSWPTSGRARAGKLAHGRHCRRRISMYSSMYRIYRQLEYRAYIIIISVKIWYAVAQSTSQSKFPGTHTLLEMVA